MHEYFIIGRPIPKNTEPKPFTILTWDDLVGTIQTLHEYIGPGGLRSEKNCTRYARYLHLLQLFNIPRSRPIEKILNERDYAYVPNVYPYDRLYQGLNGVLQPQGLTVEHGCVWSRNGEPTEEIVRKIMNSMEGVVDWIAYLHDPTQRSVQGLPHCHVFFLRKAPDSDGGEMV